MSKPDVSTSFDASDAAIEAMNGQYLCNKAISISYAFKKDAKGERHGSAAERLLAAQNPLSQADRPHQLFADAPPVQANGAPPPGGPPPPPGTLQTHNGPEAASSCVKLSKVILRHRNSLNTSNQNS